MTSNSSTELYFERVSPDGTIKIAYQIYGAGPALLLVHGFPQSKVIWEAVIPELAKSYTVITPDLRGYGNSSKPKGKPDHSNYSKREMAQDLVALMTHLGHPSFYLVGHDRGGRVSHRLAADHPECVKKLMVLDISPTLTMYEKTTMEFASGYWHWFFLIQPYPIPETLLGTNAAFAIENFMGVRHPGKAIFSEKNWQSYINGFANPDCLHGMCEDYRAASTIDLEHDRIDRNAGKKLSMPVHVLWGEHGLVNRCFQPLQDWTEVAQKVSGHTVSAGHYIPEEIPQTLISEICTFMN